MGLSKIGGTGGGFDYVQDPAPTDPVEGDEWYDTGADSAFVYDGSSWVEQTVVNHGQLSGIGSSDHHSRPSSTTEASGYASYVREELGLSKRKSVSPNATVTYSLDFPSNYSTLPADGLRVSVGGGAGFNNVTVYDESGSHVSEQNTTDPSFSDIVLGSVEVTVSRGNWSSSADVTVTVDPVVPVLPMHAHSI